MATQLGDRKKHSLHEPLHFRGQPLVPLEAYGVALSSYVAEQVSIPGSSIKGLLRAAMEIAAEFNRSHRAAMEIAAEIDRTAAQFSALKVRHESSALDWASQTLRRTADLAEQAVSERRKNLRTMEKIERRIDRAQVQTSRLLSHMIGGVTNE